MSRVIFDGENTGEQDGFSGDSYRCLARNVEKRNIRTKGEKNLRNKAI
jgi:hypothetical protein